jgi:hypothetical protein
MGPTSLESQTSPSPSQDTDLEGGEKPLPLYESNIITSPPDLAPPAATATPNEIRDFLEKLIIEKRTLDEDHATRSVTTPTTPRLVHTNGDRSGAARRFDKGALSRLSRCLASAVALLCQSSSSFNVRQI